MNGRNARFFSTLLMLAAPLAFSACNSGSSPSGGARIGCEGQVQGMCVTRCNLGCSVTGCNISEIAVNQPLSFDFSLEINPDTVNSNTIKMRTVSGAEPVGSFLVQGQTVFFFPEAKVVGTRTFFGFTSGETYTLTIPSGEDSLETIESMSGDRVAQTFACRLKVSRGIVDFDGKPPTASMLVPSAITQCVEGTTLVLLEFSEIVDAVSLLGDAKTAGVQFGLAQFDSLGNCASRDLPISGARTISVNRATQRTRLLFRPAFELPGDFCVRVKVTDKVRDLSGKRAKAVTFEFKTCRTAGIDKVIVENFDNPKVSRDDERNGAKWATNAVVPAKLGGSGVLGDFNVRFGGTDTGKTDEGGRTIWEFDTDDTLVPGIRTLTGKDIKVTNGVYEFTTFELKENEHLRFTGSKTPVIRVSGRVLINGVLSQAAVDATKNASPTKGKPPFAGEKGYAGAVGGAAGGKGGDSPHKIGGSEPHGAGGEDVQLPPGHPLAADAPGTGGKGSRANPESTKDTDACFTAYNDSISQQGAAGGGGGGNVTAAGGGSAIDNKTGFASHPPKPCDFGKVSTGGTALPISKLFARSEKSGELFLFGGGGGGGGGAHTHGAFDERPKAVVWSPGGGGAGGGGPLHLQVGGDLIVGTRGSITVKGGNAVDYPYDTSDFWNIAPGGAGAGGTALIQIDGLPDFRGKVIAAGGTAGRLNSKPNFDLRLDSLSGAGGEGFIRFEADPRVPISRLATFDPPAREENSAVLRKVDYNGQSLLATNFYDTQLFFPPKYLRVEILASIDGNDVVFSDDSSKGIPPDENAAITFITQGAQLDPDTKLPDPETLSKWFTGGVDPLNSAGGNGFRYILRFNADKATSILVKSVSIHYRG